jgi:tRNA1Val (adenine37-N6)-methyltransferase
MNKDRIAMKKAAAAQFFLFRKFRICQDRCTMKVGTDGVLLGAWAEVGEVSSALDIGTGSGVIAIMLAQRAKKAQIHAVEIHDASFQQARENMAESPWADRLSVFHTSIQELALRQEHTYDLIVSNPPFFTGGTISENQGRNAVRHTVKLPHGDLLAAVRTLLTGQGRFCVILPHIEGLRFQEMAETYRLYCSKVTEVRPMANKPVERLLLQFEGTKRRVEKSTLVIQEETDNEWTMAYKDLTREFYLNI